MQKKSSLQSSSISLPLLNGLAYHSKKCSLLLEESLMKYNACITIERFINMHVKKGDKSRESSKNDAQPISNFREEIKFHWIFLCLLNRSLLVRRRASDIIMKGLKEVLSKGSPKHSVTKSKKRKRNNSDYLYILRSILFELVGKNLLSVAEFSKEQYYTSITCTMSGSDVMLQTFGLLNYFICDYSSVATPTTTSITTTEKKTTAPKPVVHKKEEFELWSRETFVAQGGIRWIGQSIIKLMKELAELQSIERSRQLLLDNIVNETLQTRIFLLVDLLYRLVSTKSKAIYTLFWKSNLSFITVSGVKWTPFVAALALKEILQKINTLPTKVKGVERSFVLLEKLIDPFQSNVTIEDGCSYRKKRKVGKAEITRSTVVKKRRLNDNQTRNIMTSGGLLGSGGSGFTFSNFGPSITCPSIPRDVEDDDDDDDDMDMISDDEDDAVMNTDDEENSEDDDEEVEEVEDDEVVEEVEDDEHEECCDDIIVCEDEDDEFESCEDMEHEDEEFSPTLANSNSSEEPTSDYVTHRVTASSQDEAEDDIKGKQASVAVQDNDESDNPNKDATTNKEKQNPTAAKTSDTNLVTEQLNPPQALSQVSEQSPTAKLHSDKKSPVFLQPSLTERKHIFLRAGMNILQSQNRFFSNHSPSDELNVKNNTLSPSQSNAQLLTGKQDVSFSILNPASERSLLQSLCNVVRPPRKPLNLKIFLKRAPTQEEFFRGSLSKNPISLNSLKPSAGNGTQSSGKSTSTEPSFRDLRQHIADDLQMSDSAELLELLVAGKIIDVDIRVRVVQQVLWRKHVMDNSHTRINELSIPPSGFIYSGYSSDTDISLLPAMVVTYRLAGVDGEATEDKISVGDLVDPEAPSASNNDPEKEFQITKIIAEGKGLSLLLRSIERDIADTLRCIRRDDASRVRPRSKKRQNLSREHFLKAPASPGIVLLRLCSQMKVNRQKLVSARAPSLLLRLLLDVLNALESPVQSNVETLQDEANANRKIESNPTSEALQELIEVLASEISSDTQNNTKAVSVGKGSASNIVDMDDKPDEVNDKFELEDKTLSILFNTLKDAAFSAHLRKVIANLLPFLTYGKESLSRALATQFMLHVDLDLLLTDDGPITKSTLMDTFIEAAIHLPPAKVCSMFRSELLSQGFVEKVVKFILFDLPDDPPPWSPALQPKRKAQSKSLENASEKEKWRSYLLRPHLSVGFQMMIGLCSGHLSIQNYVASNERMLTCSHWIECTSDASSGIEMKGLGLHAETLLDTLKEGNDSASQIINVLRKKTRERKKQIADERRSRALIGMSAFGPVAGISTKKVIGSLGSSNNDQSLVGNIDAVNISQDESNENTSSRSSAASALASMLGISFSALTTSSQRIAAATIGMTSRNENAENNANTQDGENAKQNTALKVKLETSDSKPSWMDEMEALEDDEGLTCAVCQEGKSLQPKELLGLYAFVKKVSIPHNKGGARSFIDGSQLLFALPSTVPDSLSGSEMEKVLFQPAKDICAVLQLSSPSILSSMSSSSTFSSSSRPSNFVTSVTAGNAIHFCCHSSARTADRNHPKAPKSEWEGASLRNSRVSCNVIIPLVSSKSSQVPLVAVESALADYQSVVTNLLGARPKSMLWTVLHDLRLLLLRISYGEALNVDAGGGSITSNCELIFHFMLMIDMFSKDAEHDSPATAQHVKNISLAFLAASEIVDASDYDDEKSPNLMRGLVEASVMAGICTILFHNTKDQMKNNDFGTSHVKLWTKHRNHYFKGLVRYAGSRFANGFEDSGCVSKRNLGKRSRAVSSLADWDIVESKTCTQADTATNVVESKFPGAKSVLTTSCEMTSSDIEEFSVALSPMLTLFAILDQLSIEYTPQMDDVGISISAERIVAVVKKCHDCSSIEGLLSFSKVPTITLRDVMTEFSRGRKSK